jgi:hypothetical protein
MNAFLTEVFMGQNVIHTRQTKRMTSDSSTARNKCWCLHSSHLGLFTSLPTPASCKSISLEIANFGVLTTWTLRINVAKRIGSIHCLFNSLSDDFRDELLYKLFEIATRRVVGHDLDDVQFSPTIFEMHLQIPAVHLRLERIPKQGRSASATKDNITTIH